MSVKEVQTLSYRDMCETIEEAKLLLKEDSTPWTAKEVWEYSSTGEVWRIHGWYEQAKLLLQYSTSGDSDAKHDA